MRKPFFKKSHNAWYVHHHGKMIRLDSDREKAFQKYHELKAENAPSTANDSVASLLNQYLGWCEKHRSPRTYDWYRYFLSSFSRTIGVRLNIGSLKPFHVTRWLDAQEWNETTQSNAVRSLKRAFNWAVKQGRLAASPLVGLERPSPKRRESFVTREQFDRMLALVKDRCFRDYLEFLFETGVRPQEIKVIEAKHWDSATHQIVLPPSQSKGKTFPRVIFVPDRLIAMVNRLCHAQQSGPIFRNSEAKPWTKDSVNCRMRRLRKKLESEGEPIDGLCATSLRHGFATIALKNGVDPVTVSILMGHRDATQVARTYQHLAADAKFLAEALQKARGQDSANTQSPSA